MASHICGCTPKRPCKHATRMFALQMTDLLRKHLERTAAAGYTFRYVGEVPDPQHPGYWYDGPGYLIQATV